MLNKYARAFFSAIFRPIAQLLLRLGISPDVVTIVGTAGVAFGALWFYPRGDFLVGTLFITVFVFSDMLDGNMARLSGRSSTWGAYLDSTLDRVGDAAIFGGLVLYYAGKGDNFLMACLALACLVLGSVVSYAKARAEGLAGQLEDSIAALEKDLATATAADDAKKIAEAEAALTARRAWLEQVRRSARA